MKTFTCNHCIQHYDLIPENVGALGNGAVYCNECASTLHARELIVWDIFVRTYHTLPTMLQECQIKQAVWQ